MKYSMLRIALQDSDLARITIWIRCGYWPSPASGLFCNVGLPCR